MIVEVLITQRQPVDALGDHLAHAVFDLRGLAVIAEAVGEPQLPTKKQLGTRSNFWHFAIARAGNFTRLLS